MINSTNVNPASYNSKAWDKQVTENNQWTIPISTAKVGAARIHASILSQQKQVNFNGN